ncbi:MAG: alanine racemase [Rhodospirillales bacterium]|nr:MAG: alanine racemase [Rhodospirillales bacterium]
MEHFDSLPTPALLLDRAILDSNCRLMGARMAELGVRLRPHMKTAKSAEVARLATAGHFGGITVSTLKEAHYFAERGFTDILYAVGFVPSKIGDAAAIQEMGDELILLTDNKAAAAETAIRAARLGRRFPMMIEIDTGDKRCGLDPETEADEIVDLGRVIDQSAALELRGVLTHAGQSYHSASVDAIKVVAEAERAGIVRAAELLRAAGLPCPVVSAGSTPTARYAESLDGITEMRPGVYMFGDVDQALIGSCTWDHIALTVLASVIGHNRRTGRIIVDAGGLAMSKDIGPAEFDGATGYGTVMGAGGMPRPDRMYIAAVSQEHGQLALPGGAAPPWEEFPVGSRVRIFPNHACMTAAAHDRYYVLDRDGAVVAEWDRVNGW